MHSTTFPTATIRATTITTIQQQQQQQQQQRSQQVCFSIQFIINFPNNVFLPPSRSITWSALLFRLSNPILDTSYFVLNQRTAWLTRFANGFLLSNSVGNLAQLNTWSLTLAQAFSMGFKSGDAFGCLLIANPACLRACLLFLVLMATSPSITIVGLILASGRMAYPICFAQGFKWDLTKATKRFWFMFTLLSSLIFLKYFLPDLAVTLTFLRFMSLGFKGVAKSWLFPVFRL